VSETTVEETRGASLRTLNQVVGWMTLLATAIAFASWVLLGLGGVLPPLPGWAWSLLSLPAILLGAALIADERIAEAVKLVRELAALVLLVGLIRRLGATESAPWTDLADLFRSILVGGG
jgi:hypothetical protein